MSNHMAQYNLSDAELPTMVIRCDNMLVLRSIVTGQYLETVCEAPDWKDIQLSPQKQEEQKRINEEYVKTLESLVSLFPCNDMTRMPLPKPRVIPERPKSPEILTALPPCKVQRNYCCTFCSYYTQNPRSHLQHQRDVHGIRLSIHSCHHCQYASRYFQKLKRHIKMVHTPGGLNNNNNNNDNKPIVQAKDSKISKTLKIEPNIKQEDDIKEQLQAPTTSFQSSTTSSLLDSNLSSISKEIPQKSLTIEKDPEAFFVAAYKNQIQKQYENEQRLKDIMKLCRQELNQDSKSVPENMKIPDNMPITSTPIQKCPMKKKSISMSGNRSKMLKEEMKKRIFNCRKCNYVTHIKSRYNKHVKYHSMPMIQCDKCEFRTTYKWNLTRHLRSHHGNGIYKCSVCNFSAHMKQSLTSHEMNHHSPPVGCASGSKPMRKRRCRVGGSDLQDGNFQKDYKSSKEKTAMNQTDCDEKSIVKTEMDESSKMLNNDEVINEPNIDMETSEESDYVSSDSSSPMHIDADNIGYLENTYMDSKETIEMIPNDSNDKSINDNSRLHINSFAEMGNNSQIKNETYFEEETDYASPSQVSNITMHIDVDSEQSGRLLNNTSSEMNTNTLEDGKYQGNDWFMHMHENKECANENNLLSNAVDDDTISVSSFSTVSADEIDFNCAHIAHDTSSNSGKESLCSSTDTIESCDNNTTVSSSKSTSSVSSSNLEFVNN